MSSSGRIVDWAKRTGGASGSCAAHKPVYAWLAMSNGRGLTPQTMQALIVSLERAELVARRPHATHGRVLQAFLTAAGSSVLDHAHGAIADVQQLMLAPLSAGQREQLVSLLGPA